jgi:RNA polymerase sigma factor (sigma-70 family)
VRDAQIAEDVAQDVFAKAYMKLGTLRDADKIKSWLSTMTKRRAIDWLRQQQRQPELVRLVQELRGPNQLEEEYIRTEQLHEALMTLDVSFRRAFIWHEWQGYTAREISLITRESLNTIESRIRRARVKLRNHLESVDGQRIMVRVAKPLALQQPLIVPHQAEFEKKLVNQSILAVMLHLRGIAS